MRKKLFRVILFCFPTFLFAQDDLQEEVGGISTSLQVGQYFDLGQAGVKFLKVISDSRCPKQVTCIWPGEAKVLLGISINGEYFEKEVVISGRGGELSLEGLNMQLSHLRPYPETALGIAHDEYCLRFSTAFPAAD